MALLSAVLKKKKKGKLKEKCHLQFCDLIRFAAFHREERGRQTPQARDFLLLLKIRGRWQRALQSCFPEENCTTAMH